MLLNLKTLSVHRDVEFVASLSSRLPASGQDRCGAGLEDALGLFGDREREQKKCQTKFQTAILPSLRMTNRRPAFFRILFGVSGGEMATPSTNLCGSLSSCCNRCI